MWRKGTYDKANTVFTTVKWRKYLSKYLQQKAPGHPQIVEDSGVVLAKDYKETGENSTPLQGPRFGNKVDYLSQAGLYAVAGSVIW